MLSKKDIPMWVTTIRKLKLTDDVTNKLLNLSMISPPKQLTGSLDVANAIEKDNPLYDEIVRIIIPELIGYAKDIFKIDLDEYSFTAWHRNTFDGRGLEVHDHSGSNLTATVYLEASEGDLVVMDPRGLASRGYPSEVRLDHFGNFRNKPNTGDVLIFPSYLYHFVEQHKPSHRSMLAIDFIFKD